MSDVVSLLPLVFVFVVFYAVLYLPQRRRNKKHKEFVENLKIRLKKKIIMKLIL